jgi:hypothetical protein
MDTRCFIPYDCLFKKLFICTLLWLLKKAFRSPDDIVACKAVAMQRPRDKRVYQGRFGAAAR